MQQLEIPGNKYLLRPDSNDEDDNESNRAQPETKSMTSFEHLKQMESLDKFMGKRLEANLSDMAEEDEQDSQRRDANIASASTVIDHPTRQNHLLSNIEKQGHKAEFQQEQKQSPQKAHQKPHSKFKKQRPKEDVKSVEPPMQLSYHNIQNMKNINKSTERAGGNNSSEGNSNSNENKSQDSKLKGLTGAGEKKVSIITKNVLGNPIGMRAFKSVHKKIAASKLKTQSSATLIKRIHKKNMLSNPAGGLLAVPGHPSFVQSQLHGQQQVSQTGVLDPQIVAKIKQAQDAAINQDDLQSIYSGGSGMAPSLVSGSINFFPQGNAVKTDEDNQSAANPGEKLQESGESSDDMNSQDAEASDRDVISEEEDVIMSHSSDSDHEEDHEDEIEKKQTSFNQPKASPLPQQVLNTSAAPSSSNFSPPKQEMAGSQEKAATNSGGASQMPSFGNIGAEANEAYDMIKPLSKKSFEEDTKPIQRKEVKQLDLE